jgi:hypothetical protein
MKTVNDAQGAVFIKNLRIIQPVNKFLALYVTKNHHRVHKIPPLIPILRQKHQSIMSQFLSGVGDLSVRMGHSGVARRKVGEGRIGFKH